MRKHIVVLGGGFGGAAVARALRDARRRADLQITLVSRENEMLFTPFLPEAAVGLIAPQNLQTPLVEMLTDVRVEFGEAIEANVHERSVTIRSLVNGNVSALMYDELVIALGGTVSALDIPGVREHALFLKSAKDAACMREHVLRTLERAAKSKDLAELDRLLRFVVVGGDFTGVELAGELQALLKRTHVRGRKIKEKAPEVVIVEGADCLLKRMPAACGKYAARKLRARGVRFLLEKEAASIDAEGLMLRDGTHVVGETVIWAVGEKPAPIDKTWGLAVDEHGALKTNGDCSVVNVSHVWALGDCAAIPRPTGGAYAPLAQNALQEAKYVAENILARLEEKPTKNVHYRERGEAVTLGERDALLSLPGGMMITGLPAWLSRRGYYLCKLPERSSKIRIVRDWIFGAPVSGIKDGTRYASQG